MTDKLPLKMDLQLFASNEPVEPVVEPNTAPAGNEPVEPTAVNTEPVQASTQSVIEPPEPKPADTEKIEALEAKVAELEAENAELKGQVETAAATIAELTEASLTAGEDVAKAKETAEAYQKSLEAIVAEKEKEIPDDIKALMPDNISVTDKLDWLTKAETLKNSKTEKAGITEIGKPTPVTQQTVDQSELSVTQRLSNVFSETFNFNK